MQRTDVIQSPDGSVNIFKSLSTSSAHVAGLQESSDYSLTLPDKQAGLHVESLVVYFSCASIHIQVGLSLEVLFSLVPQYGTHYRVPETSTISSVHPQTF